MKATRRPHTDGKDPRRGSALVASVVVVMLAAAMGSALLQVHAGSSRRQRFATDQKRALYISEAGLSEGYMALAMGKSGNVASPGQPAAFGDGVFWVEAHDQPDGKIALVSTGLCGSGRFATSIVLQKQVNTVATLGMFGAVDLKVGASCMLDGYDSTVGTYASQAHSTSVGLSTGTGARVNANNDITVQGPSSVLDLLGNLVPGGPDTTIFGDAHPGPAKSVLAGSKTNITGSTTPALKPLPLPGVDLPPVNSQGSLDLRVPATTYTGREARFDTVRVRSGAKLILKGPAIMIMKELRLESSGQIQFDTSTGPVAVYVTTTVDCTGGSQLSNVSGDPRNVALLVGGDSGSGSTPSVSLLSSGEFYGSFYAPTTAVTWPASLRLYGSVAAQRLTFAANARASFDVGLLNAPSVLAGLPGFVSWRVVELPKTPLVASNVDPLVVLKAEAITPDKSDNCHKEKNVNLTYMDASGNVQTYSGPSNLLDWSLVKSIVQKVWSP